MGPNLGVFPPGPTLQQTPPHRAPVCRREVGAMRRPKRLEALRLDADHRRRRGDQAVQPRMGPTAPRETNLAFDANRTCRPLRRCASRQGRHVMRPVKEKPEGVRSQCRGGFRAIELSAFDLVAGRCPETPLDLLARNAGQKPACHVHPPLLATQASTPERTQRRRSP